MALPLWCAGSASLRPLQCVPGARVLSTSSLTRYASTPPPERRRRKVITDATPPKELNGLFYREIIPPMSKMLGYTAITFFVLYGAWHGLNTQADAYQAEE